MFQEQGGQWIYLYNSWTSIGSSNGHAASQTGVRMVSSELGGNVPYVFTFRGKESGTSMAAAMAQFMQCAVVEGNNSLVESREIKNYFIRGASRSNGVIYPNRDWGWGSICVKNSLPI